MKIDVTRLELALANKQYSATKLSEFSGVSRATISYIRNGKSCKPEIAGKIAHALGVDVTNIIQQESSHETNN